MFRNYSLEDLRSEFSYVFQDVFLFSNTINANISFAAPKVRSEAVRKAAGAAQASSFYRNTAGRIRYDRRRTRLRAFGRAETARFHCARSFERCADPCV